MRGETEPSIQQAGLPLLSLPGREKAGGKASPRQYWLEALGLGAGMLASAFVYSAFIEPSALQIVTVRLRLPRLDREWDGFRLVQISDIHMGGWMNRVRLERVVRRVLEQNPDAVAITGDFISRFHLISRAFSDLAAALSPLSSQVRTVAVLGNHDHRYGRRPLRRMFARIGIQELDNRVITLRRGTALLHLAGVDDIWLDKEDLPAVLGQLPPEGAAVLLAHEPDFADRSAACGRFDLQISGHTHGGQLFLPFLGRPSLPKMGTRYPSGLYQVGRMLQYTNRGVGMGMPPFRFNCPPEITVFVFET